jgi:hypothetical protein
VQYETLEDAVKTTTQLYVEAATQLAEKYGVTIWVQSVPPVLPETRDVVQAFNSSLKQQLAASSCRPSVGSGSVYSVYLDELMLQHGGCLDFDGTHLHPAYIQHLEAAMHCNT